MTMGRNQLSRNGRLKTVTFINANGDYFFNHILNYGRETVFLPNRQVSLWDKWRSGEKALDRFFLAAGFN
jgi:hypothetical protein